MTDRIPPKIVGARLKKPVPAAAPYAPASKPVTARDSKPIAASTPKPVTASGAKPVLLSAGKPVPVSRPKPFVAAARKPVTTRPAQAAKRSPGPTPKEDYAPPAETAAEDADVRVYIPPPIEETQKLADAGELVEGTTPQEDLVILTDEEIEPEQDVETPDDTGLETEEAYEPADTASVEESPRKGKFPALSAEKKGIQKRPGTAVEKERPPESLPVLTAFQQFLDRERRRMRARIFVLIMFFSAIMLLTVAGLLFAARTFQARIQDDLDRLQTDINSVGNSGQSALSQLQAEASDLRKELDMEKNARKNLSGNRTEIESKINAYAKRLEKLTATTELLQAENAILQTKLGKLKDQVRIAATSPGNAVGRRSGSTMTLSVLPRGGKHARQWRVPIPE